MIFDINVRKQNRTKIVQNSPAMIKRKKKNARITNEIRYMKGHTTNYMCVKKKEKEDLTGKIENVKITKVEDLTLIS